MPPVHVVLLNWNGWRDTIECLESLFRLDYPELRIVVCDNGSTDGSVEHIIAWAEGREEAPAPRVPIARDRPIARPVPCAVLDRDTAERGGTAGDPALVIVRTGANLGFAGGNNVGLRYVLAREKTGHAWILNNDVVVAPDSLRRMVKIAEREAPAVVGGTLLEYHRPDRVETVGGGRVLPWAGFPTHTTRAERPRVGTPGAEPVRVDFISGGCLLAPVEALRAVGLIDERYFLYCEDTDWSFRAVAAGWKLRWDPGAIVWHKGGGTVGHGSVRHDYYIVKSSLLLVHRFRPRWLPAAFVYSLYRALLPKLVRLEWARARAVLMGYVDFLRQARAGAETPVVLHARS